MVGLTRKVDLHWFWKYVSLAWKKSLIEQNKLKYVLIALKQPFLECFHLEFKREVRKYEFDEQRQRSHEPEKGHCCREKEATREKISKGKGRQKGICNVSKSFKRKSEWSISAVNDDVWLYCHLGQPIWLTSFQSHHYHRKEIIPSNEIHFLLGWLSYKTYDNLEIQKNPGMVNSIYEEKICFIKEESIDFDGIAVASWHLICGVGC